MGIEEFAVIFGKHMTHDLFDDEFRWFFNGDIFPQIHQKHQPTRTLGVTHPPKLCNYRYYDMIYIDIP